MIGIPLAAASLALGGYEAFKGAQGLKKLNKEKYPEYSISPELQNSYGRAEQMAGMGYTPQEAANFRQNVAQQQNTGFRQGVNAGGGNLAQALRTGLQAQNLGAFNSFSASDAALHRSNIHYADQLGQQVSNQRNLITGSQVQRRNMLEQAFGGALRQGLSNMAGSLNLTQAMGGGMNLFGNKTSTDSNNGAGQMSFAQPLGGGYTNTTGGWLNQAPTEYYNPTQTQ